MNTPQHGIFFHRIWYRIFPCTLFLGVTLLGCTGLTDPPKQDSSLPSVRIAYGPSMAGNTMDQTRPPEHPTLQANQADGETFYTVRRKDSLWSIATAHHLSVQQLVEWNRINKSAKLRVGQRLRLTPVPKQPSASGRVQRDQMPVVTLPVPSKPSDTLGFVDAKPLDKPELPPKPTFFRDPTLSRPSVDKRDAPAQVPGHSLSSAPPRQWVWPHSGRIIGRFGQFGARRNTGIDIYASPGDAVLASADGVVAYADQGVTGYGNMILIRHGGSFMTAYAHLQTILVKLGQTVKAGQTIALSGQTGITTSPRLHFEIRRSMTPQNPLLYLPPRMVQQTG
ncbi:MAG: M23 family metallopeptidase [Magnetococcus sp. YQC-5]